MKTFQQFLQLAERYYEPDEKLPSGETPVGKATRKSRTRAKTIGSQSPQNQERWARQYDLTQTKVKHGADNPEVNTRVSHKDKDDLEVSHDSRGMYLKHKPSGVYYWVYKSDNSPYAHTIEWNHDNDRSKLSRAEREQVGRDAKKVWDQHISHRLPYGTIAHNAPAPSLDSRGREKPLNRRSSIYQRAGFGKLDDEGDQFASVGREPSPRQKAKGKKRLKPLNPREVKVDLNWDKDDDDWDDDD